MSPRCSWWVQGAVWVTSPSLTLAMCSSYSFLHPPGINWKLGLLLLLGLVPQILENSAVYVGLRPSGLESRLRGMASVWLHSLVSGSGDYFGAFSRLCMLLLKSELLHFILPQFAHL